MKQIHQMLLLGFLNLLPIGAAAKPLCILNETGEVICQKKLDDESTAKALFSRAKELGCPDAHRYLEKIVTSYPTTRAAADAQYLKERLRCHNVAEPQTDNWAGYYSHETASESVEADIYPAYEGQAMFIDFLVKPNKANEGWGGVGEVWGLTDAGFNFKLKDPKGKPKEGRFSLQGESYLLQIDNQSYILIRRSPTPRKDRHPWSLQANQKNDLDKGAVCFESYNPATPPDYARQSILVIDDRAGVPLLGEHPRIIADQLDLQKHQIQLLDNGNILNTWTFRFKSGNTMINFRRSKGNWHLVPNDSGKCGK